MHERDDGISLSQFVRRFREDAKGEAVDDDRPPRWDGKKPSLCKIALRIARPRKALA
jgi:hypothetical protein